jgi:putative DNA primase/helicase
LVNFNYDTFSQDWFKYNEETGHWARLAKFTMQQKIYEILKSKPKIKDNLTTAYVLKVKTAVEWSKGVDFNKFAALNIRSQLVPFKNGVLNLNTIELLKHDRNFYFTYNLNICYEPDAKISKPMLDFFQSITNNNLYTIKILRSFIKCLLLRDNQFQVALYLYGPGGTGKSTFEKLLTSLVGNSNTAVLNLKDLNKQFAISKVVDKSLLLISDVQLFTGDPSQLRLLISGDLIHAEKKYKDSFDIQPKCLVVLSSNIL